MQAQHEQWEACSNLVRTKPTANDHGGIEGGILVCDCPANTPNAIENARMIAAAPELLQLLADAREALMDERMDDLRGILAGDVCAAAIAKAKGE